MNCLQKIADQLAPLRAALLNHRIYQEIDRLEGVRIFMEHHVFAVWDFMSLLKVLQRRLCCVEVPWLPPIDPQSCRFINEMVLAEESDSDGPGGFASHFDLYRQAMQQCGADTRALDGFLSDLRGGAGIVAALDSPKIPAAAREFVQQTFKVIETGGLCPIVSAFAFGREDLLPDVFQQIVNELNANTGGRLDCFEYYLQRHIALDGDEHGPLAARLLHSVCGDSDALWKTAEQTAVDCLTARQDLWNGISAAIGRQAKQ